MSSPAHYPSPSTRAAARARMRERATAAAKQIEITTDSKADDIGDSQPVNNVIRVTATAGSPQCPLHNHFEGILTCRTFP
jgi:hypothetical protein